MRKAFGFAAKAIALSALALLLSGSYHGAFVSVIEPSSAWNGVAGSGSCPAVDATQQVSGLLGTPSQYLAIGNVDAPPQDVVETPGSYQITAAATASNRTGIAKVQVCLEGTIAVLTQEATNPMTGSHGFNFVIQSRTTSGGQNGFVNLVVDYYPRDGYVLRTTQVMWLNSNASGAGYINRTASPKWVDPVLGTDGTTTCGAGGLGNSKGNPYKTVQFAIVCVPDGNVVYVVSGATLNEMPVGCPNGICGTHTHLTTVMPEPGGATFTFAKATRQTGTSAYFRPGNGNLKFYNFIADFANITEFYITGNFIASNCVLTDSRGLFGGKFGSSDGALGGINGHSGGPGYFISVTECTYSNPGAAGGGVQFIRNVSGYGTSDNFSVTSAQFNNAGTRTFNYAPNSVADNESPGQTVTPLTVASVGSFTGGHTVITFSGSPGIGVNAVNNVFAFLSGALQGTTFPIFASTATTITVTGNATAAAPGDLAWNYFLFHCDCFQFFLPVNELQPNYYNVYFQNYHCQGDSVQAILPQPQTFVTPGTFSTAGSTFTMDTLTVSSVGAFSGGQTIITLSGTPALGASVPTSQKIYFNSGALSGQNFAVAAMSNAAHTVTVTGDATAAVNGDIFQFGHNMGPDDYVELGTSGGAQEAHRAVTITNPVSVALAEAFSGGNQTLQGWRQMKSTNGVAIVGGVIDRYGTYNGDEGQVSSANRNWAFVQTTWLNSPGVYRTDGSFGLDNFNMLDAIIQSMDALAGHPVPSSSTWPWDNNQFLAAAGTLCTSGNIASNVCGTNSVLGAVTFDIQNAVDVGNLGNEGNGTIGAISPGGSAQRGTYLITLSDGNGTYTGVTHFTIQRPDKTFAATGTVGTPYTSSDINFTITAGATAFNYFDRFLVMVNSKYKPQSGLSKTMVGNLATGKPLYGWNVDGTPLPPISSNPLIGAQQP